MKRLPRHTASVYRSVLNELKNMSSALRSANSLNTKKLNTAADRIDRRISTFVKEEIEYTADDYLPYREVEELFRNEPYTDGELHELYSRWMTIYRFLSRRVVEYQYSDMTRDEVAELIEKYGYYLVGTHELLSTSGLAELLKEHIQNEVWDALHAA